MYSVLLLIPSPLSVLLPRNLNEKKQLTRSYRHASDECTYFPDISAIFRGFTQNNLSLSDVAPICNTGNCTWPEYASLAICSSVEDVSSTVTSTACNNSAFEAIFQLVEAVNPGYQCLNYSLPDVVYSMDLLSNDGLGPPANATLSNGSLNSTLIEHVGSLQLMNILPTFTNSSSLASAYLMYQPDFLTSINSSLPSPLAYRLNLDFCIQTYNTTVSNGVTDTTALANHILRTDVESFVTSNSLTVYGNDTFISFGNETFGSNVTASGLLGDLLQSYFATSCFYIIPSALDGAEINATGTTYCPFTTPFFNAVSNSSDPLLAVRESLDNIAISITNEFRTGAGGATQIGQIYGTAFSLVVLVETNYLWLIFPTSLVGLTLVFLLATILKSERLGSRLWKSSNLATLQGLDISLHTKLGGLSTITEMEEKAKELKVRFDMKSGVAEQGAEYRLVGSRREDYWKK